MKTPEEIQRTLPGFTGTEQWYVVAKQKDRTLLATDGVKYLCEAAESYWLMDVIWSYLITNRKVQNEAFLVVKLKVQDKKATFTLDDGNDHILVTQEIEYTDFPLPELKLYVGLGSETDWVVMLPSEY